MIHNQHQMSRHSYTAGEPWGRSHVEALAADHSKLGACSSKIARPFLTSLITTGGGIKTPVLFIPIARGALAAEQLRVPCGLRSGIVSLASQAVSAVPVNSCGAISGSRTLSFHLQQHSTRQSSNAAEGHLVHSLALSRERTCRAKEIEPCSPIRGKTYPR